MTESISEKLKNEGHENHAYEEDEMAKKEQEDGKKGFCSKFTRGIRGIWATEQTEENSGDKDFRAKTTMRELIVYCIFLLLLCIMTWGLSGAQNYQYNTLMTKLFTQTQSEDGETARFVDMKHPEDLLNYVENVLVPLLYDKKYTGGNNFHYESKLQGVPRIRQVRVRKDVCKPPAIFKHIKVCYAEYSESARDESPYGSGAGFTYSKAGSGVTTEMNSYGTGGYHVDLNTTLATSLPVLHFLRQNLWVDRSTRAIFVDFTVYNANINLFCVIKLIAEYPPTGGIIPSFEFRTVKLIRYNTASDMFVLACEFIFCLFILYYIGEEFLEISKWRMHYLLEFWNVFDLLILVISLCCISFDVYRFIAVNKLIRILSMQPSVYIDFDSISYTQVNFSSAFAAMVFFAWIKIFKYVKINKTMSLLSKTLGTSAKTIGEFSIMFFVIFLAFAQSGYLLFSSKAHDFCTFDSSLLTLFRVILADFDIHTFKNSHSILGPLYFVIFVFLIYFILTNMFIAILTHTYSTLKNNLSAQPTEVDLHGFIAGLLRDIVNSRKKGEYQEQMIEIEGDENNYGTLSHSESFDERSKKVEGIDGSVGKIESQLDVLLEKMNSLESVIRSSKQEV